VLTETENAQNLKAIRMVKPIYPTIFVSAQKVATPGKTTTATTTTTNFLILA
jgi:hypothetical protein